MQTYHLSILSILPSTEPFVGEARITLSRAAIVEQAVVAHQPTQVIPLSNGEGGIDLLPNVELGDGTYYTLQLVSLTRQVIGTDISRIIGSYIFVMPPRDCDITEIITVKPTAPEPFEAAKAYASEAKEAVSGVAASATNAATSAGQAQNAAEAAATSAGQAATSATESATSVSESATSATAAATSAGQAATSATGAATSASESATSATNAATSATAAATSAGQAATSATAAATSATNAATSAGNAVLAQQSIENLVVDATTGAAGSDAAVQKTVIDGVVNLSFTIPTGQNGNDGEDGEDGEDGITPTFTIGTVTTLPAGSEATVTITGTDAEPVLNLGIPAGQNGSTPNVPMASTTEAGKIQIATAAEVVAGTNMTKAVTPKNLADRVAAAIAALVASSPETLDTLNELAAALGDDPNFATTVAGQIGTVATAAATAQTAAESAQSAANTAQTAAESAQTTANSKWTAADATTSVKGIVKLSNATNSTSTSLAASAKAVKLAWDKGNAALTAANSKWTAVEASTTEAGIVMLSTATGSTSQTTAATSSAVRSVAITANAALPKSGGTMTGGLTGTTGVFDTSVATPTLILDGWTVTVEGE